MLTGQSASASVLLLKSAAWPLCCNKVDDPITKIDTVPFGKRQVEYVRVNYKQ